MNLYLAEADGYRFLIIAASKAAAADAMRRYTSRSLTIRDVPANVMLPIVARVVDFAR